MIRVESATRRGPASAMTLPNVADLDGLALAERGEALRFGLDRVPGGSRQAAEGLDGHLEKGAFGSGPLRAHDLPVHQHTSWSADRLPQLAPSGLLRQERGPVPLLQERILDW